MSRMRMTNAMLMLSYVLLLCLDDVFPFFENLDGIADRLYGLDRRPVSGYVPCMRGLLACWLALHRR